MWKIIPSAEFVKAILSYCHANHLKPDSRQMILIMAAGYEALTGTHIDQPLRKRGGDRRSEKAKRL